MQGYFFREGQTSKVFKQQSRTSEHHPLQQLGNLIP